VGDPALSDDQDAAVAQRGEPGAEVEVAVQRLHGVERELHDGDVGAGEGVHEHRPGAVVRCPRSRCRRRPDGLDDIADLVGELGQAGAGVVDVEQRLGEAEEVVDGAGPGIAVTAVPPMYQCAETTRMARGRGTERPKARQAWVQRLPSSAFIGLPCPKNAAACASERCRSSRSPSRCRWILHRAALLGSVSRELNHRTGAEPSPSTVAVRRCR